MTSKADVDASSRRLKASQIREIKNTAEWAKQIAYWRTHLDVFIEDYFQIKLKNVQKVQARIFGNRDTIYFVQSRGFGKTWITAVCCIAIGVLYPGSLIAVISGTAEQATLVLKKIDDYFIRNENVSREIEMNGHKAVQINQSKAKCSLKNGSKIESYSLGLFRGNRAKVIVIDEAPEVKKADLEAVAKPVRNTTRDNAVQLGFKDYTSKMVSITSAYFKSNYFFDAYKSTLKEMAHGDKTRFACALDYKEAARCGISSMDFFLNEKKDMTPEKFAMEYGSYFIGAEANSVFPYELTEKCRVLKDVEIAQPERSKADYIVGIDLATSSAKEADNAVFCVIKRIEREDGNSIKRLVYIRSYHGKRLDYLAKELRRLLILFPNTSKVVFDHRGLGDAFPQFMSQPWTDPVTNKEYPPLVLDNERSLIHGAVPLLHPVIATLSINQQLVSRLTVALEQGTIELPVSSRLILGNKIVTDDDEKNQKKLSPQERAIFIETDALQVEMGNIVGRETASGSIVYDTAKSNQHKDRYSAVAMAVQYISDLEYMSNKIRAGKSSNACVGIVLSL